MSSRVYTSGSSKSARKHSEQHNLRGNHTDPVDAALGHTTAPSVTPAYVVSAKRRSAASYVVASTPAAQKAVAKARRRRWREATAPLTAEDYDRVRENLESSSSCEEELKRGIDVLAAAAASNHATPPSRTRPPATDPSHSMSPPIATAVIHVGAYGPKGGSAMTGAGAGNDEAAAASPPRVVILNPMSLSPIRSLSPRAQKHRMVLDDHTHFYRVYSPPPPPIEEEEEALEAGAPAIPNLADRPRGGVERPSPPTTRPPALCGGAPTIHEDVVVVPMSASRPDVAAALAPGSPPSAAPSPPPRSPLVAGYLVRKGQCASSGSSSEEPPLQLTPQRIGTPVHPAIAGALHYDGASPTHSTMMAASRCDSDADMRGDTDGWVGSFAPDGTQQAQRFPRSPNAGATRWGKNGGGGGVDTGSDLVDGGSGGDDASCWSPNHLTPLQAPPTFQLLGDDDGSAPSSPMRRHLMQRPSPGVSRPDSPGSPTLVGVGVSPANQKTPLPAMTAHSTQNVETIETEPSCPVPDAAQAPAPSHPTRPHLAYVTTTLDDDDADSGNATPASGIDYVENSPSHFRGVSHSMSSMYRESEEVQEELRAIREVDKSMQDEADAEQMLLAEAMVQSVPPKGSPSVPVVSGSPPRPMPPASQPAVAYSPRFEPSPTPPAPTLVAVDVVPVLPNAVIPPPPSASRPLPPNPAPNVPPTLPVGHVSVDSDDDVPVPAESFEAEGDGNGSLPGTSPQQQHVASAQREPSTGAIRKSRPLPSVERLPVDEQDEDPLLSPQPSRPMPTSSPLAASSSSPRRSRPLPAVLPLPADDGPETTAAAAPVTTTTPATTVPATNPSSPAEAMGGPLLSSSRFLPVDNGTKVATTATAPDAAPEAEAAAKSSGTAAATPAIVPTVNKNLVRRAKVVHVGTSLREYHQAVQAYLRQLKVVRNKLPQHANDAVRDVLAFATSFGRAAKALKASVTATLQKGQESATLLSQPHAWIDHDLAESDDVVYTRLLDLVADELDQVEQQLSGLQEVRATAHAAEQLLDDIDLSAVVDAASLANLGDAVRRLNTSSSSSSSGTADLAGATAGAVAGVVTAAVSGILGDATLQLRQLCQQCRHAEVTASLLCDLQRIYPCGFIPIDAATNAMVSAIAQRLIEQHASEVEELSAFVSIEGARQLLAADMGTRADEDGEVARKHKAALVTKACTDRVWMLRDVIVDYDESATFSLHASPPRAPRTPLAGRFPFVSSVTSQVHHLGADTEEAYLVKTCADSHQYCAASQDRLNALRSNREYRSLLDATMDSTAQLMACIDAYAVQLESFVSHQGVVEWMSRTLGQKHDDVVAALVESLGQQQQQQIMTSPRFTPFQQRRDPPPHAQLKAAAMRVLQDEVRVGDNRIIVLQQFLSRRRRMHALLQEEIDMVRTLVQVPLALDPDVLLWMGTDDATDGVFKEPTVSADERAAVLDDVLASNRAVAKANFLLIGNGLVSSGKQSTSASNAQSDADQLKCLDALHAVHEAQEVVAAALRRMQLTREQRSGNKAQTVVVGANTTTTPPPPGGTQPSPPQPSTTIALFGPRGPTISNAKATTLIGKMRSLQSPGIIAFVPDAIRRRTSATASVGIIARCTLRLSRDAASLEFSALRDVAGAAAAPDIVDDADGGGDADDQQLFERVAPITFGSIEMILQGPTIPLGVSALQCAKFVADTDLASGATDREVYFPSFASFMEWSEVLQLLLKARHLLPSAELLRNLERHDAPSGA